MYLIFMVNHCYWITGLSASGKSTISKKLRKLLIEKKQKVILLDGDNLRKIFDHHKYDNISRLKYGYIYANLCKFLINQNTNVIIAIGGLFHELHMWNKKNIPNYIEIFLDVPIDELERRDPKGLYKKFRNGKIKNLNGADISPELPKKPSLKIKWNNHNEIKTFDILKKYISRLTKDYKNF